MRFRDWFHPPRHVLTIFLGVALVCGCALGWLAWLLLEQDKALEVQQRQERIEQAADRAVAVMQRALADLASHLRSDPLKEATLPPGVTVLTTGPGGILVQPHGALLYYPEPSALPEAQSQAFSEGEQREFAQQKLPEAARSYSLLMSASDEAVRAGALTRLARVYRKLAKPDAALRAYDRLSAISLAGLPRRLSA